MAGRQQHNRKTSPTVDSRNPKAPPGDDAWQNRCGAWTELGKILQERCREYIGKSDPEPGAPRPGNLKRLLEPISDNSEEFCRAPIIRRRLAPGLKSSAMD